MEHDGLRERRDLVDDRRVEVPLHEALRPRVDVQAGRAHDAVEVADVRRLDVDPVREGRRRLELQLVRDVLGRHVRVLLQPACEPPRIGEGLAASRRLDRVEAEIAGKERTAEAGRRSSYGGSKKRFVYLLTSTRG